MSIQKKISVDGDVGSQGYHPVIPVFDSPLEGARRAAAHVIVADLESPALDRVDGHHLDAVLRLRSGEAVSTTDGRGGWRLCRFVANGGLVPDGEVRRQPRPTPLITVGLAPVKGDRPEWAVQKLTEIGVDRIVLLRTGRGVVQWEGDRAARHLARLQVVARQALMQSRRVWLPEVAGPEDATVLLSAAGVAMATPGGGPPSLDYPTLLIGPEGGWNPLEEASARARVELGPAILRTESAAMAAGVLLAGLRAGLVRPA